ncbi:MAG TPA: hypothetical protein VFF03_09420 [Rhodocyclaceae bacterium]|nr:hypothetical protein [Rhodocyclaceae bacterium]
MDLAPQVKDATEAIQHVPPLVDAVMGLLQTPTGFGVLLVFFTWLVINKDFSHLFQIFERKEKRRAEHLDLYVSKPELADTEAFKVLSDLRDAYYFKMATGIYAEKKLRQALIDLHGRTSHKISWGQIRRAFPYIEPANNGEVVIRKLTTFEKIGYWYNQAIGYGSLLSAAVLWSLFFLSSPKTTGSIVWGLAGTFAPVLFAMFVFAQNWPVGAAKRIQRELATGKSEGSESAPEQ